MQLQTRDVGVVKKRFDIDLADDRPPATQVRQRRVLGVNYISP
jgi:hypothetical protein